MTWKCFFLIFMSQTEQKITLEPNIFFVAKCKTHFWVYRYQIGMNYQVTIKSKKKTRNFVYQNLFVNMSAFEIGKMNNTFVGFGYKKLSNLKRSFRRKLQIKDFLKLFCWMLKQWAVCKFEQSWFNISCIFVEWLGIKWFFFR